jgi:hypothetical protein
MPMVKVVQVRFQRGQSKEETQTLSIIQEDGGQSVPCSPSLLSPNDVFFLPGTFFVLGVDMLFCSTVKFV